MKPGDKKFYLDAQKRPCGLVELLEKQSDKAWKVETEGTLYNWDDLTNPISGTWGKRMIAYESELMPQDPPLRFWIVSALSMPFYAITDADNTYLGTVVELPYGAVLKWSAYGRDGCSTKGHTFHTKEEAAEALRE